MLFLILCLNYLLYFSFYNIPSFAGYQNYIVSGRILTINPADNLAKYQVLPDNRRIESGWIS